MNWNALLRIGDLDLTLPAAAAVAAWLLMARAWRPALWWCGLFALGIALVATSKIAFLGWGTGLPGLDFKAVSGHAMGVTALLPTVFYLVLASGRAPALRAAAVGAGLALGLSMAVLLVLLGEHSAAEAMAGWALGALVSLGAIRAVAGMAPLPAACDLGACGAVFLLAAWMMQSANVGYWMILVALLLSGKHQLHEWDG